MKTLGLIVLAAGTFLASAWADKSPIREFDLSQLRDSTRLADARASRRLYDEVLLVSCLQGLVNRDEPRLFVRYRREYDDFWIGLARASDGWLADREFQTIDSLESLLGIYRDSYRGLVVYDESVPATSNVAASIAGADDLLPVRYDLSPDSLFCRLTQGPNAIPVKIWLIEKDGTPMFTGIGIVPDTEEPSSGSAKNDAYRWLISVYLEQGRLDPRFLGYYIDAFWLKCWQATGDLDQHTLNNLDYLVAHRGLVFDLDVSDDEAPIDDRKQIPGTDFVTLRRILAVCNRLTKGEDLIFQFGFVPWIFKYTTAQNAKWNAGGKHDPVRVEWKNAAVLSAFNGAIDADALSQPNLPNASFYQHQRIPASVPQKSARPNREALIEKGILNSDGSLPDVVFYAHYAGDYDSTAWLYANAPKIWNDPQRGKLPLSWAFNPNLSRRFPLAMLWTRETATSNDIFVTGDSGAGYLNPARLTEPREWSALPDGVDLWRRHNEQYYKQWDLDVTGFVIEGREVFMSDKVLAAYAAFSPGGICTQLAPPSKVFQNMPIIHVPVYLPMATDGIDKAAATLKAQLVSGKKFIPVRSILWSPSDFVALEAALDRVGTPPRKLVDLSTLLWLQRYQAQRSGRD